jgi:hypothetical protein
MPSLVLLVSRVYRLNDMKAFPFMPVVVEVWYKQERHPATFGVKKTKFSAASISATRGKKSGYLRIRFSGLLNGMMDYIKFHPCSPHAQFILPCFSYSTECTSIAILCTLPLPFGR